ncbi:MAG: hypothetical protein QOH57_4625, partial [Mycobacterium sp.]|nr:hypothetical protein [Mycobacterium sp.]
MTERDDFLQEHLSPPPPEPGSAQPADPSPPHRGESAPSRPEPAFQPPERGPSQSGGQPPRQFDPSPPTAPWQGPAAADAGPPRPGDFVPHQPEPDRAQTGPQPQVPNTNFAPPQREQPHPPVQPPTGGPSSEATQAFNMPRPERQAGWQPPPREPSGPPRTAGQWQAGPRWQEQGSPSTNWSYVDGIRSSELVPTRKPPPARGWRRAVFKATFGLVNPGQSPDELRQAALESKIRSVLRGHYKIGVLGKGGVGKTTLAASVGSVFAELRQDDRVVAIDADTSFGKLGSRVDPHAAGSYWELAADEHLDSFADVRSRVGNNSAGLFVLAGEASTARRRVLDPAVYREAAARLDRHFTISI